MPAQEIITVQFPDGRVQSYVGPHAERVAAKAEARGAVRIDQGEPAIEAAIGEDVIEPAPPVEPEEQPSTFMARRVRRDPASGDVIEVEGAG